MRRPGHPATLPQPARPGASGFTLLEAVVVLVLLGLLAALSAPALAPPAKDSGHPLQLVLDDARRAALRRAESLTLTFRSDGGWALEPDRELLGEPLGSGRLAQPIDADLRIRISPLGSCWLETARAEATLAMDPLTCRLRGESPS